MEFAFSTRWKNPGSQKRTWGTGSEGGAATFAKFLCMNSWNEIIRFRPFGLSTFHERSRAGAESSRTDEWAQKLLNFQFFQIVSLQLCWLMSPAVGLLKASLRKIAVICGRTGISDWIILSWSFNMDFR